jgi:hypothetical protein
MNNSVYCNEFSLSTTGPVQVRRLGHLPDLVQPIAALLFVSGAFSLHSWCSKRVSLLDTFFDTLYGSKVTIGVH